MKKYKILLLCHPSLLPVKDPKTSFSPFADNATEQCIYNQLVKLGHEVHVLGLQNIDDIHQVNESYQPDICFNLMEEYDGNPVMDSHIVSYLEMLPLPYTGNGPKALLLARDKSTSKKVLEFHNIPTPSHFVVKLGEKVNRVPEHIGFPLFVKSRTEEASFGISQASIVKTEEALKSRVKFIHEKTDSDAIVDEFIEGRELYLGILGNKELECFPIYEMDFGLLDKPHQKIATEKIKWDENYRSKNKIDVLPAKIDKSLERIIMDECKKAYIALELTGYARFDIRLKSGGDFRLIEVNPNPNIAIDDEFAMAAASAGYDYPSLIQKILDLAIEAHS